MLAGLRPSDLLVEPAFLLLVNFEIDVLPRLLAPADMNVVAAQSPDHVKSAPSWANSSSPAMSYSDEKLGSLFV